jgi:hypothetical protein
VLDLGAPEVLEPHHAPEVLRPRRGAWIEERCLDLGEVLGSRGEKEREIERERKRQRERKRERERERESERERDGCENCWTGAGLV